MFMHTCIFVCMILPFWSQLEGRLLESRPGEACAGWGWLALSLLPGWSLLPRGCAPCCWLGSGRKAERLGGKGLSFRVHIWEPLAHSCRLSACLQIDLDGTGREGLGGRFATADENPDASGRQPGPAGGKGPGEAPSGTFPLRWTSGQSVPQTWLVLPSQGWRLKLERDSGIPQL